MQFLLDCCRILQYDTPMHYLKSIYTNQKAKTMNRIKILLCTWLGCQPNYGGQIIWVKKSLPQTATESIERNLKISQHELTAFCKKWQTAQKPAQIHPQAQSYTAPECDVCLRCSVRLNVLRPEQQQNSLPLKDEPSTQSQ